MNPLDALGGSSVMLSKGVKGFPSGPSVLTGIAELTMLGPNQQSLFVEGEEGRRRCEYLDCVVDFVGDGRSRSRGKISQSETMLNRLDTEP